MSGFNYYAQFESPIIQQGVVTNLNWTPIGTQVYNSKPEAITAAQASGVYGVYNVRIIKSSWEIVETIPPT
jgi:hypothetical protein